MNPYNSPSFRVDGALGNVFPMIREVHKELKTLAYIVENLDNFKSKNIVLSVTDDWEFLWKYSTDEEWNILGNLRDLLPTIPTTGGPNIELPEDLNDTLQSLQQSISNLTTVVTENNNDLLSTVTTLSENIDSINSRIDALNTRIDELSVGEEEVVYFDEPINNILTSGSLSIEALPNFIITPLGEDVSTPPPAIQSDSATEGKWYVTISGNEYDVTAMGISLGDNGELLLTPELVAGTVGIPFTYRATDANSNMVQTQIYIYSELDTGDIEQIKLVDGPNILASYTGTLGTSGPNFVLASTAIVTLDENIVSFPESVTAYKHIRGYTLAVVEPTLGLTIVYGEEGTLGYYNNYYNFVLVGDRVLEDNGYFLHIVCEGLVLVSKPIQYFNSRQHPQADSYPEVADRYITDFLTHTVDFGNNYGTVDQFIGDPNFMLVDDFNGQDTLEASVLFPYINKRISLVITTTENLVL